jgi:hypothetical protein
MIDNIPIRQKFDEVHHQVPTSALPASAKTVAVSQLSALTPVRSRTPAATVCLFSILNPHTLCVISFSLAELSLKNPMLLVQHDISLKRHPQQLEENY